MSKNSRIIFLLPYETFRDYLAHSHSIFSYDNKRDEKAKILTALNVLWYITYRNRRDVSDRCNERKVALQFDHTQ